MASQSSARVVSYDLRPAKQSERKMMVDGLLTAIGVGLPILSYRYVGMGANRFYDFIMMHRYLGISNMVSIERDAKMFERAAFNRPFQFIAVENKKVHDFLLEDRYVGNTVYWLDYDGALDTAITDDLMSVAGKAAVGDFVFVTVSGAPPRRFRRRSAAERLSDFKELFVGLAGSLVSEDVEDASFPVAVHKILAAVFRKGFSPRREGVFRPFFRIRYADSTEMVTFGGVFDGATRSEELLNVLEDRMPFLQPRGQDLYRIRRFDLTDKERRLFDLAVTARQPDVAEVRELRGLGFARDQIDRYRELLRYHPRYVETFL